LRHPGGEGVAADHDGHLPGVARQVHRSLAGGVGPAGNEDVLTGEGAAFGRGRPVEDTGAEQGAQPGSVEPAVRHARGDQDAAGVAYPAVGQVQGEAAWAGLEPGDRTGQGRDGAKRPCLLERPGRQARAADATREAQEVADQRERASRCRSSRALSRAAQARPPAGRPPAAREHAGWARPGRPARPRAPAWRPERCCGPERGTPRRAPPSRRRRHHHRHLASAGPQLPEAAERRCG
jgi:hypothetical protein